MSRKRSAKPAVVGEARKVGRPSQLSREIIAQATHEIGLANLTMKAVADRLGVSVPGLYHHIEGKNDLMRLAAEYSAELMELPADHGQHWSVWLQEWAEYNRKSFVEQPELLMQFLQGAIGTERTIDKIDAVLGLLVRQGFTIREARTAYQVVSEYAIGAAVAVIRERSATNDGRPSIAEYLRVLAQREPGDFPYIRMLVADEVMGSAVSFHDGLIVILRGLAAARGEDWAGLEALVALEDDRLPETPRASRAS